jgi:hypothetical protein
MSSFELKGPITQINATQEFPSGFSKREFVVEVKDGKYPQAIKFECIKDKAALLDDVKEGDEVTVYFNIRGSEYKGRHFVNLHAWKLLKADGGDPNPKVDRALSSLEAAFDNEPDPADANDDEPPF